MVLGLRCSKAHPELLRETIATASLDAATLAPRPPTPEAALTRASEAVQLRGARITEGRDGEPVDDELYANILVRPADRGVKQVVTEVLDRSENRLAYRPLAGVYLDKEDSTDELVIEPVEGVGLLPVEGDALRKLRRYYEYEKNHHDGEGARRVIGKALSLANAVPLRNSGGMYCIPKSRARRWRARLPTSAPPATCSPSWRR